MVMPLMSEPQGRRFKPAADNSRRANVADTREGDMKSRERWGIEKERVK